MYKRMILLFSLLLCLMSGLLVRLFLLGADDSLAAVAQQQAVCTLTVAKSRGTIYDRNLIPLTGGTVRQVAAVSSSPETLGALLAAGAVTQEELMLRMRQGKPFLALLQEEIYHKALPVFAVAERYAADTAAAHIVGHLGSSGEGVYGAEKAFDSLLAGFGGELTLRWAVDAQQRSYPDSAPQIEREAYDRAAGGVVLTIDKALQRAAERAAAQYITEGAVVVMAVESGEILASVSLPDFDPADVAASLDAPGQPFVNRAFSPAPVGSLFKVAVACAALEAGIPPETEFSCGGSITVAGRDFGCHWKSGHGTLSLQRALGISCNPYFIALGQQLGGERVLAMARLLGLGQPVALAEGWVTDGGTLPTPQDLQDPQALANFSFGQGELTASPLQMARLLCAAVSGYLPAPQLVRGSTEEGRTVTASEHLPALRVISDDTAAMMRQYLTAAVEEGSGAGAAPFAGGAGGKTASAQTGRFVGEEEVVDAWFGGFWPAEEPEYVIVVYSAGGGSGAEAAVPVFHRIADHLCLRRGLLWEDFAAETAAEG